MGFLMLRMLIFFNWVLVSQCILCETSLKFLIYDFFFLYFSLGLIYFYLKNNIQGFPGGSVVESTCQCRRYGLDPQCRRIPHAEEQLNPCATTEAVL